jgi:hypothetical protein
MINVCDTQVPPRFLHAIGVKCHTGPILYEAIRCEASNRIPGMPRTLAPCISSYMGPQIRLTKEKNVRSPAIQ